MPEVTLVGMDLAKRLLQLHGARCDGAVAFREKRSRGQLLAVMPQRLKCMITMVACPRTVLLPM